MKILMFSVQNSSSRIADKYYFICHDKLRKTKQKSDIA